MLNPSEEHDWYWIYAIRPDPGRSTPYTGKWLLYVPVEHIDECWAKVRDATVGGHLGIQAKVATMKPNPNARNPRSKVICIYTGDCRDLDDVTRVLGRIRELGFPGRIFYKEDAATRAGNYSPGKSSLYESPGGDEILVRRDITEPPE